MAQTLKDEARVAIIEAAKQEFLEKGYKGASMRSIAEKANMTVGNLYRYFKNKEDINLYIVGPTFKQIETTLKSLTSNNISMETRVFNLKPDIKDLRKTFDEFADNLVDIYFEHKTEFNILMLHSRLSEVITSWLVDIINSLISSNFVMNGMDNNRNILSTAYAQSCFAGLKVIFKQADDQKNVLKMLVKTYLRSFLYMLDCDFRSLNQ